MRNNAPKYYEEYLLIILNEINKFYSLNREDLVSKSRNIDLRHARYMVIYSLSKIFGMSTGNIGGMVNRDHSTIIHNLRRVEDWEVMDKPRWHHLQMIVFAVKEEINKRGNPDYETYAGITTELKSLKEAHQNQKARIRRLESVILDQAIAEAE